MKTQVYLIDEDNDWEGETFGYLLELTKEQADQIKIRFAEEDFEGECTINTADDLTRRDVMMANKFSTNNYRDRLSYMRLKEGLNLSNFQYQNFPYKGNGMKPAPLFLT
jgi:hypothetical protein